MADKCYFCGKPFGMARKIVYRIRNWRLVELQFCSARCKRVWQQHWEKQLALIRWIKWLRLASGP